MALLYPACLMYMYQHTIVCNLITGALPQGSVGFSYIISIMCPFKVAKMYSLLLWIAFANMSVPSPPLCILAANIDSIRLRYGQRQNSFTFRLWIADM